MNYSVIYNSLISRSINRIDVSDNVEKHHIIPRCMGGSDDADNIAGLTCREHFIAHRLLVRLYPSHRGLAYGLWRLMHDRRREIHISSREYARLREQVAVKCGDRFRGKSQSKEHIEKCRVSRKGRKKSQREIEKNRLIHLGSKRSDESKIKMSASWKVRKSRILSGEIKMWNRGLKYKTGPKPNMRGKQTSSKLTKSIVDEIRSLYDLQNFLPHVGEIQRNGVALSYLQAFCKYHAEKYCVTSQCLKKIIRKETWPDGIQAKH